MKRDMDLIRQILLEVEEGPAAPPGYLELEIEGRDPEQVSYHVLILRDAGLLEARDTSTHLGMDVKPVRLTWEGHEFLDAARDDAVWKRATNHVATKVGGIPFDVLLMVLKKYARDAVLGDGGAA